MDGMTVDDQIDLPTLKFADLLHEPQEDGWGQDAGVDGEGTPSARRRCEEDLIEFIRPLAG